MKTDKKYKVGITVGVFDLFHVGHLNLLERCKAMCDKLVVAVCGDDYVANVKHKDPVYPEDQRRRILASLKCVDEVIPVTIEETEDKMLLLKNHPFDVLFSGDDWKGSERYLKTEKQFAELGVSIEYLPYTKGVSTTETKDKLARPLAEEAAEALRGSSSEQFQKLVARYGGYWRYKGLLDYYYLVNPYFPTEEIMDDMREMLEKLIRDYPSGQRVNANLAAEYFQVPADQILVGNGASELIQAYMDFSNEKMGFVYPTFEEYANRYPEDKREMFYTSPANGFRYGARELIQYFDKRSIDGLVLLNPDMPTGNFLTRDEVMELTRWTKEKKIRLLIDESFVDFAENPYTCISGNFLSDNAHVAVIKSISKSYGVPGLRLGVMASGNRELVAWMKKKVSIWNINSIGEYFFQIIGRYAAQYDNACKRIVAERLRFAAELKKISYLKVYPSDANFILAEVLSPRRADELSAMLWENEKILFRDCSKKKGFDGRSFVRIAIRDKADNDVLLAALKRYL